MYVSKENPKKVILGRFRYAASVAGIFVGGMSFCDLYRNHKTVSPRDFVLPLTIAAVALVLYYGWQWFKRNVTRDL